MVHWKDNVSCPCTSVILIPQPTFSMFACYLHVNLWIILRSGGESPRVVYALSIFQGCTCQPISNKACRVFKRNRMLQLDTYTAILVDTILAENSEWKNFVQVALYDKVSVLAEERSNSPLIWLWSWVNIDNLYCSPATLGIMWETLAHKWAKNIHSSHITDLKYC